MNYEQQINAYLDGRMSEDELDAFEAAFFADDALAAELDRAIEIRSAMADSAAQRPRRTRSSRSFLPLAAAALLAVVVFGVYENIPPDGSDDIGVLRGESDEFRILFSISNNTLSADWAGVSGAGQYQLDLYGRDGTRLDRHQTGETSTSLQVDVDVLFLRVTALDELGNVLADSGLLTLEASE